VLGFREISSGLKQLGLKPGSPVMVHASLSAFGPVRGGTETLLGAILANQAGVMMPAFTYKTMLVPEDGPADNAIDYGSGRDQNRMAEFFRTDMPVDGTIGRLAETLRLQPSAQRSLHPILSFVGINVEAALQTQTLAEPLAPIGALARQDGWVLLMGVDQTRNTSLHYAEQQAGRPQFTRWALTYQGVRECPNMPGRSHAFERAAVRLKDLTRKVRIGTAQIQALRLSEMIDRACEVMRDDPLAFLCDLPDCPECSSIRRRVQAALSS